MSDIRQMSVAMQQLVHFISMVTNSMLLRNNTGVNSTLLRNYGKKLISVGSALTLQLWAVTEEERAEHVFLKKAQFICNL
jgi:hypothetical protein